MNPTTSFTIPSIHDDIPLDCRIYHPESLSKTWRHSNGSEGRWRRRGIVMAHPYAPLGGSYDDPCVAIVVEEFVSLGYIVGTFNFRGVKGRTSWSGKPELDDYMSFAGFFIHYLSHLRPYDIATAQQTDERPASQDGESQSVTMDMPPQQVPIVILGGYSYGSLVLRHLPPIPSIIQPFSSPPGGSAAEEIVTRARKIADQDNLKVRNIARDATRSRRKLRGASLSVTVGGEETPPQRRRTSREVRRSFDERRSLELGDKLRHLGHKIRKADDSNSRPSGDSSKIPIEVPEVRYLLISPITAPLSTLIASGLGAKPWHRAHTLQEVIGKHTTLIVYGDSDGFSSVKKLNSWVEKLSEEQGSQLTHKVIEGAGHFWHDDTFAVQLRTTLVDWELNIRS